MKRYLLFAGDIYYPMGGWNDFIGDFDTLEHAREYKDKDKDWFQIVDTDTMEIVQT